MEECPSVPLRAVIDGMSFTELDQTARNSRRDALIHKQDARRCHRRTLQQPEHALPLELSRRIVEHQGVPRLLSTATY